MMAHAKTKSQRDELDEFTLARAQRGDADACRALFERYRLPVGKMVSRYLSDKGRIEDISQETFLRVFKSLGDFSRSGPATLSTWIFTIAINLCRDEARRAKTQKAGKTKSLDWGFDGPGPLENSNSPEDRLANKRALLTLDDAIRKLPEAQRDALVLSILGELSTDEIARVLDCKSATVKTRVHRARARLKDVLRAQEVQHDR